MRLLVLTNLFWLFAFLFLFVIKLSLSEAPPPPPTPSPRRSSNSLIKRPSDLLPSKRHDETVLVATLDGTLSLVEIDSRKILWSIKTGLPIYSSYQASQNLDAKLDNASEIRDDTYIDCGDDWNLYRHNRRKGIIERLKGAKDLIRETKAMSTNGTAVIGQMATTVYIVDAKTGSIVRTVRFSDSTGLGFKEGENSLVIREENKEQMSITRTDYSFLAYSRSTGKVMWNVTLAEFEVEAFRTEVASSLDQLGPLYESEVPASCLGRTVVYRIRDRGYSDLVSGSGLLKDMPRLLPGDKMLPLPAPDDSLVPVPRNDFPGNRHDPNPLLALPSSDSSHFVQSTEFLALPSFEFQAANSSGSSSPGGSYYLWPPILSSLVFLLAAGYTLYKGVFLKQNTKSEDLKIKATTAKKKRPRKSGNGKNNSTTNNTKGDISNATQTTFTGMVNGQVNGYQVGKLLVTKNEIAKGSNGTIVVEGTYDGRPVAVKRLVLTHHDVALKEIQNLMASDQHPNIVRFHGVESDSDFVYLSLERCLCSLNDFIYYYSGTSCNSTNAANVDAGFANGYTVQLPESIVNCKDVQLWKANGYPSPELLKLMRDMVSGVAHLHELGFIHRDLKPQNVLISKDKVFYAKLSDMGISKRLIGDASSFTHHATGIGSSGWRAPEQIRYGRQTRAVDLFSLGCVLFFCMSGGKHPFGDNYERDANIVRDHKDLFLVEHVPEAVDLISSLLHPDPEMRLKAADVLHHPLFWSSEKRLSFLRDASDRVELEDRETDSQLLKALEATAPKALNGKWDDKLETSFLTNISRYRRYKYDSIRDLLRVIRNKLNHYRELPVDIQEVLGSVPDGFDNYFRARFPRLLIEVFNVISMYCREEELLGKYFKSNLL